MSKLSIIILIGFINVMYPMSIEDQEKTQQQIVDVRALIAHEQKMVQSAADARESSSDPSEITSHVYDFLASKKKLAIQEEKLAQLLAQIAKK